MLAVLLLAATTYAQPNNLEYVKQYGSVESDYQLYHATDTNNNLITAALIENNSPNYNINYNIDADTYVGAGPWSSLISKFDASGNPLWSFVIEADSNAYNSVEGITTTKNGDIYLVGNITQGKSWYGLDTLDPIDNFASFVLKLDPNGNLLWKKIITGTGNEQATCITIDNTGDIYVGGLYNGDIVLGNTTYSLANNNSGNFKGFLVKYDANGNYINSFDYGNTSYGEDFIQDVKIKNNGIYVSASIRNGTTLPDGLNVTGNGVVLMKFDTALMFIDYSLIESNLFFMYDFDINNDGDIYIAAAAFDTFTIDNQIYNVPLVFTGCAIKIDGTTMSPIYTKLYSGNIPSINSVLVNSKGDVYNLVEYSDTISIDNNTIISPITGGKSYLLMQIDTNNGNYIWHKHLMSSDFGVGYRMRIGLNDNIYIPITGVNFINPIEIVGDTSYTSLGVEDIFLLKLTANNTTAVAALPDETIQAALYPNPVTDIVTIYADSKVEEVIVYNLAGQEVKTTSGNVVYLNEMSTGIYFLKIHTAAGFVTKKVVKK